MIKIIGKYLSNGKNGRRVGGRGRGGVGAGRRGGMVVGVDEGEGGGGGVCFLFFLRTGEGKKGGRGGHSGS